MTCRCRSPISSVTQTETRRKNFQFSLAVFRSHSHRMQNTKQKSPPNHCFEWECSHSWQEASRDLLQICLCILCELGLTQPFQSSALDLWGRVRGGPILPYSNRPRCFRLHHGQKRDGGTDFVFCFLRPQFWTKAPSSWICTRDEKHVTDMGET